MSSYNALDEGYFNWLYALIAPTTNRNPARTHFLIIEQLFRTDFKWSIPNDDNREADGRELRIEFLYSNEADRHWLDQPCSVLELLIGLSRRLSFEGGGEVDEWFWQLMENLEIRQYTDENYTEWESEKVAVALEAFIEREYTAEGRGGLFPLDHTSVDQREIELWYQMSYYLLEGNHVDRSL